MRIALVNDVRMAVEALRRVVVGLPDADVAWIAEDGQQAIQKCQADRPDLILMDLIMPVMDGVEATRRIMQECPCPILVVTATVTGNCAKVYEALGHGAVDAVNTPVLGRDGGLSGADELARKIRSVGMLYCDRGPAAELTTPPRSAPTTLPPRAACPLVVIGSSTGGPQALCKVLAGLSGHCGTCSFAIVIVQHLDPLFVPGLATWLQAETQLPVQLVEPGGRPTAGTVHVACTPDHLVLDARGQFDYVREPAEYVHRPSVDVLFNSLVTAPVRPGVAVLLTGMGSDGALGLQALHQAGWTTIAQDQATSVVWGMPGAAVRAGAADQVLPVDDIGAAILRAIKDSTNHRQGRSLS